ncbi:hypothetical protein [Pedobacter sp. UC225_65]|uniref:TerC family protein n=1 Tax=Pedobacter sp. UC225_65 TaxID=3350173 RepID=UPI003671AE3F
MVLGIDNIVFISILSGKLPQSQQKKARQLGLALAMIDPCIAPTFTNLGNELNHSII